MNWNLGRASQILSSSSYAALALTAFLLVSTLGLGQDAGATLDSSSPMIQALQHELASGMPAAESAFWEKIQKLGTPLMEEADARNVFVTFLWRGDRETRNVVLVNTPVASSVLAEAQLARIPGTNVWYKTCVVPADARFVYELSINDDMTPFDQVTDWGKRTSTFRRDPMNPRAFRSEIFRGRSLSYFEGPKAPPELWITPRPGNPKGRVEQTSFASRLLGNTRELWIYTPPGFEHPKPSRKLPLLLVFDGGEYVSSVPVPTILDNLIAAKRIPAMLAVFVSNAGGQRERELNANSQFAECIATELVPWLRERYPVSSSSADNIIAGSSSGGLAASFVAYKYPNIFGNVLSQSGAYFFSPPPEEEPELLPRMFVTSPRHPTRFYIEVGTLEMNREPVRGVNMVSSNRHFRDVLLAKGYPVVYHEFVGGHSDLNWREGFGNGLLALLGDQGKGRSGGEGGIRTPDTR